MHSRPNAWLRQAENDLAMALLAIDFDHLVQECVVGVLGRVTVDHISLVALLLRPLSRMAISCRYPLGAMPTFELFDQGETDPAIKTERQFMLEYRSASSAF